MDGDGDADIVGDGTIRLNVTNHPKRGGVYQQIGVATKGTRGVAALMGAKGPFQPGHFSSLTLRHVPKAFAVVVAGVTETNLVSFPWVGTNTYVAPQPVQAVVQLDAKGAWSTGVTLSAGVAGTTILFQAYVLDKTAPVGFISTNGVRFGYRK